ncbi:dentin sialophosphoprotein-like [Dorcoceras hygrometricum]|uniref:Dentin sialophosphoprotein-like n=1 Tax=Dorcoceras hygrometricum TaxID=472368 RepID=A0A2Z7BZ60_9LAMI|nr:dentin sialophosphoprotein-like [Dorcoceras hygrometricum]
MTKTKTPSSACTRSADEFYTNGFSSSSWPETIFRRQRAAAAAAAHGWRRRRRLEKGGGGGGITDSACKNQLVVVTVQYGPFNPYIPIRSTTIGKSRVAIDPIAMHTSWRSNSDIASVTSIGYPRMSASGESSTTMHRLLHASGSHTIPTPCDPKLIHSTNGNHLESPKEGSSIDHQVTIYLHAQNITMFPTNETWYFASQILVSNSGGLILILTAQSTRNMFRIHSDY